MSHQCKVGIDFSYSGPPSPPVEAMPGFLRSLKIRTLACTNKIQPTPRDRIHETTIFTEVLRKNLEISQT